MVNRRRENRKERERQSERNEQGEKAKATWRPRERLAQA